MVAGFFLMGVAWIWLLLRYFRRREFERTLRRPEVIAAADFWMQCLNRSTAHRQEPFFNERVLRFGAGIREALARHWASHGFYPYIGIYYYAPHRYGANPVLVQCLREAGLYCHDDTASIWVSGGGQMQICRDGRLLRRVRFSKSDWLPAPDSDWEPVS
jgi:hypothetical protein